MARRTVLAGTVAFLVLLASASAAKFLGGVTDASTKLAAGSLQLEGTAGGGSCWSTGTGSGGTVAGNLASCGSGDPWPAGVLSTSASSSVTTTLASPGNTTATSTSLAVTGIGAAAVADVTGNDPATAYGGITFGAAGPLSGSAVAFDGTSGHLQTSTSSTNPSTFTIAVWFKTTASGAGLFGMANAQSIASPTESDRMLWIDNSGKLVWEVAPSGTSHEVVSGQAYNDGNWHLALASLGAAGMQLWVDGTEVASSSSPTTAWSYTGYWQLGWARAAGLTDAPSSNYWNGSLAGVSVMPTQLSSSQIATLSAAGTFTTYAAAIMALSPTTFWAAQDAGASSAVATPSAAPTFSDVSGNGNTAMIISPATPWGAGPAALGSSAAGATFAGSSGYLETTSSYANPETFSIALWFKTSAAGAGLIGFTSAQSNSGGSYDRQLWVDNSGKLVWGVYNGTVQEVTSGSAYNDGNWHFVVASVGAGGLQLWVDGSEVASNSSVTTAQNYTGWWHLGWVYGGWTDAPTSTYLTGSLSEVAIFHSQLTAANVAGLYAATSPSAYGTVATALIPWAYWPLQAPTTPALAPLTGDVPDSSGNGDNGTAIGGAASSASGPSALGALAITFDGSTGYVQTATSYSDPATFSIALWFKTTATTGAGLFGFSNVQAATGSSQSDRNLWIDNTGKLDWGVYTSSAQVITSTSAYNDGNWHFAVASIGSAGMQLWVDGTEVASNSSVTAPQSYTGWWHLGKAAMSTAWTDYPTDLWLTGAMSEAAVVPTQLSSSQIATLYAAGSTSAYATDLAALTPTASWPMQGVAPGTLIEATVAQTVGSTTTCLAPAQAGACPAPAATPNLAMLGTLVPSTPTGAVPVTLTVTLKLATGGTAYAGLDVLADLQATLVRSSWSATVSWPSSEVQL